MDKVVHICERKAWLAALKTGEYRADSVDREGFIHCSRPEQVLQVANAFYSGVSDLVLLWIEPQKLAVGLRWEMAEGEMFPHVYGPLNLEAVSAVQDFQPDPDGVFRNLPLENEGGRKI